MTPGERIRRWVEICHTAPSPPPVCGKGGIGCAVPHGHVWERDALAAVAELVQRIWDLEGRLGVDANDDPLI